MNCTGRFDCDRELLIVLPSSHEVGERRERFFGLLRALVSRCLCLCCGWFDIYMCLENALSSKVLDIEIFCNIFHDVYEKNNFLDIFFIFCVFKL